MRYPTNLLKHLSLYESTANHQSESADQHFPGRAGRGSPSSLHAYVKVRVAKGSFAGNELHAVRDHIRRDPVAYRFLASRNRVVVTRLWTFGQRFTGGAAESR